MRRNPLLTVTVFFILALTLIDVLQADEISDPQPVTLGAACLTESPAYFWYTVQKTTWSIDEFYAIPVSSTSVESWSDASNFKAALLANLQSPGDSSDYAVACVSVWQAFVQGNAKLFLKVHRNISTTTRLVQCQNEFWTITNEVNDEVSDQSDFLLIGSQDGYQVDTITANELEAILQETLDSLNEQPGAATSPFDIWIKQ